ncbi:hypothetical protein BJX70DRAFT_66736 [Aspergillus crustosus]
MTKKRTGNLQRAFHLFCLGWLLACLLSEYLSLDVSLAYCVSLAYWEFVEHNTINIYLIDLDSRDDALVEDVCYLGSSYVSSSFLPRSISPGIARAQSRRF